MFTKPQSILISRIICVLLVLTSTSLYFTRLEFWYDYAIEIIMRVYILFLCGVMGHEGSHGNLGMTGKQNDWWSRFVFIPMFLPNAPFRITHRYHHAFTNEEGKDPDLLLKIDSIWQFPGRAVAMPHYWVLWLVRNKLWSAKLKREYIFSYLFLIAFYSFIAWFVGIERILVTLLPAQMINSFILWYPFAIKTHEGHLTGEQIYRSHDYYGKLLFWLTCGLSLHRAHHLHQRKAWLELYPYVQKASLWDQVRMKRDIRKPIHE